MAAGNTYVAIAIQTVSGSTTNQVDFTSISGSYTDLRLVVNGFTVTSTDNLFLRINSDTGSNYSQSQVYGDGTSAGSTRTTNRTSIYFTAWGNISTTPHLWTTDLLNYSNTTTYKSMLFREADNENATGASVALWRSTSAITSLSIYLATATKYFGAGSTLTLYGILAA